MSIHVPQKATPGAHSQALQTSNRRRGRGSVTEGAGSERTGPLGTGPAAPPTSRWSDVLARRVLTALPADEKVSVAQAGIGGNTVRVSARTGLLPPRTATCRTGSSVTC